MRGLTRRADRDGNGMAGYASPRDLRGHQTPATTPPPSPSHGPCLATTSSCNCSNKLRVRGVTAARTPFSTYSGVEVLSFFYQKKRRAGHGRAQAAGDGGIAGGVGVAGCGVGEKRREGRWVRRGGLVAASCCFDPVDSGVVGRLFFFFCVEQCS